MSKTIGKASLKADDEGLVTLQCDRCKSRFKMEFSYLMMNWKEMIFVVPFVVYRKN